MWTSGAGTAICSSPNTVLVLQGDRDTFMKGRVEVVQGKGREAPNHLEGQESQTARGSANNPTLLLQWGCGGREGRWEGGRGQSSDDLDATQRGSHCCSQVTGNQRREVCSPCPDDQGGS